MIDKCRKCNVLLDDDNWSPSFRKNHDRICKSCMREVRRLWRKENPEKQTAADRRYREENSEKIRESERRRRKENPEKARMKSEVDNRRRGLRPFNENKECGLYLGVHVAERLLQRVFKDVGRMPHGNPGYDFICNNGYLIDSKSSCTYIRQGRSPSWQFSIRNNIIADYFVLLAFDNRYDLEPLHIWMIPGNVINDRASVCVSESTICKWDEYALDINKVVMCCDTMKGDNNV